MLIYLIQPIKELYLWLRFLPLYKEFIYNVNIYCDCCVFCDCAKLGKLEEVNEIFWLSWSYGRTFHELKPHKLQYTLVYPSVFSYTLVIDKKKYVITKIFNSFFFLRLDESSITRCRTIRTITVHFYVQFGDQNFLNFRKWYFQ